MDHARDLGQYSLKCMGEMMDRHPLIGDVRGLGLFLGIELVKDRTTRERATDKAEAVMYSALSKGLSFKLTIKREEMDKAFTIIDECLTEVEKPS